MAEPPTPNGAPNGAPHGAPNGAPNGAILWLDGGLRDAACARIDPADRGFTLGDGVFETIRIAEGIARHLDQHCARLRAGAAVLGLTVPFDDAVLGQACAAVIAANALAAGALRLTLTRGPGARGLAPPHPASPTVLITGAQAPPPPRQIAALVSRLTRRNEHSPLAAVKSLNALDNILARREALAGGAAAALLRNTAGLLADGDMASLFVLHDGAWLTPRVADGALPGTLRARLIAKGLVREAPIAPALLPDAAALCLGNALGLSAIATLEGIPCPTDAEAIARLSRAGL